MIKSSTGGTCLPVSLSILLFSALLLSSQVLGADGWHHPLSLSGGDYWRNRIRIDISNPTGKELIGRSLTLPIGQNLNDLRLSGEESQSIRIVDGFGKEVLFFLSAPDGSNISNGPVPEGASFTFPVECPEYSSVVYWVYFDNPAAWQVPDFLRPPYLANGGMEEGSGPAPTWWRHDSGDFDHRASWVAEMPYAGERCLKLEVTSGASNSWISTRQSHIPVEAEKTYTLEGWVRAQDVSSGSLTGWYIHVATEEDSMAINRGLSAGGGSYDWKKVSWTFTTPPGAIEASVGTMLWGSGTAWFDEVSLETHDTDEPPDLVVSTTAPGSLLLSESGLNPPWFDDDTGDDIQWQYRVPLQLLNTEPSPLHLIASVNVRPYTPRWRDLNPDSFRIVNDSTSLPFVVSGDELVFEAEVTGRSRHSYYLYFSSDSGHSSSAETIESLVSGATNRVFNPSFEQSVGSQPIGWSFQKVESTSVHRLVSPGLFGNYHASFTVPPSAEGSVGWPGWIQNVPVTPGKSCFFSGWVKLEDVQGPVRIHAHMRNSNGDLVGDDPFFSIGPSLSGTTGWTQLSGTVTVPPGATILQLHLTMNSTGSLSHDGILLLEGVTSPVQRSVEARETGNQVQIWSAPAVVKIFEDDHPPLVRQSMKIAAAGGEFEPLQLAVRSPLAHSLVQVEVDPPRNARGDMLSDFEIAIVGFVPIPFTSDYHSISGGKPWEREIVVGKPGESGLLPSDFGQGSDGWAGWWPDPLLPTDEFELHPKRTQPVWITFWIPPGTSGGDYLGTVRLLSGESTIAEEAFQVHVWEFTLPEQQPTMAIYDVRSGSQQYIEGQPSEVTYEQLLLLMADHRVSPEQVLPQPLFTISNGSVSADYEQFDETAALLLETLGLPQLYAPSVFYLFGWANPPAAHFGEAPYPGPYPYSGADRSALRPEFKNVYQKALAHFWQHLQEKGWDQRFVLYISDEPHYWEEGIIEQVKALCEMIHEVDADIPIYSSVWNYIPEWEGYIDVWGIGHYGIVSSERMEQLRLAGNRLWFTTDGHMCIDTPYCAIERLLPHLAFHYGVEGYEFWGIDWRSDHDPWKFGWHSSVDLNFGPGIDTHSVIYPNGDGYLIYPGSTIGHYRAVPTIRLAQAREGQEDAELLLLLQQRIGQAKALGLNVNDAEKAFQLIRQQVSIPGPSGRWSTALLPSPEDFYEARVKVGEAIESIESGLRKRPSPSRDSVRPVSNRP